MMNIKNKFVSIFTLSIAIVSLTSCIDIDLDPQPDLTHFYLLEPTVDDDVLASFPLKGMNKVFGVSTIQLPSYLETLKIVSRSGNNISLNRFHRWGELLEVGIGRVVGQNLRLLTGLDKVRVFPWRIYDKRDYELHCQILEFGPVSSGQVGLEVDWMLTGNDGQDFYLNRSSKFYLDINDSGNYPEIVNAMSRLLEEFSKEVTKELRILIL